MRTPEPAHARRRRWVAGAFGRRNGAPAKALAEKLAWIAEHETNPWMILKAAEFLRDMLDGKLRPAPEVKDPRRLARIILTNGHAPGPPAEAAAPAESPREYEENGERFVSVPPRE
jgi:hypothetical protein